MRIRQGTPVWYRTRRAAIYAICAAALVALFAPQLHAAENPARTAVCAHRAT